MFLCDTLIDGDVCNNKGMAVYVSQGIDPERPSTFYPISHTQWAFSTSSNSKYLGISSSDTPNVSGKFSGVFTAPSTDLYTFTLVAKHTIKNNVCYFPWPECSVFVEIDLSYSGTGSDLDGTCTIVTSTKCSDASKLLYVTIDRYFNLVSGQQYPLFAGLRHVIPIPQTVSPWLKLTYHTSSSSTEHRIGKEAIAGLSGYSDTSTSSPSSSSGSNDSGGGGSESNGSVGSTPSPSNKYTTSVDSEVVENVSSVIVRTEKTTYAIVGGVSAGIVVVVDIIVTVLWFVIRKKRKNKNPSGSGSIGRRKDGNGPDRPDTRASGAYSSNMSGVRKSRSDSRHSSGSRSSHTSRTASAYSSNMNGVRKSRSDSRYSSGSRNGHGSRMASAYTSRMNGVRNR